MAGRWEYFKDEDENIWARRTSTGSYGLVRPGWFENKFCIMPTPTVPKGLISISEKEAEQLLAKEVDEDILAVAKD